MTYLEWRRQHGVSHGHCPCGCEKPQPRDADGRMVCGRCLVLEGKVSVMIACTPEVCE